ncbi:transcriptional activator acu-15 [Fusarium tjaetaba]|uniref:Transcriptional activator acu-15 n=1 Tax=Fusarium tjaetaba TaxID=1567544 RepID=A0A8H5S443_9HYPO|nr:transcriptional activator acu-15 [Fusarium tjaetaba]KAF5646495.1 transcriptional activator acu-15 [Fusarium tjaetaba]
MVVSKLPTPQHREDASSVLACMKAADRALSNIDTTTLTTRLTTTLTGSDTLAFRLQVSQAERYLGKVSDVCFFNLVKRVLQAQPGSSDSDQRVDSYEQVDDIASPSVNVMPGRVVELPSREAAKAFADVYFSTVHLAFPFIPQSLFMRSLDQALDSSDDCSLDNTRLALICTALSLALPAGADRSMHHVSLLLAQCFYMLAVCRTDSCWATLGQTVRMAQSIGLHVEQNDPQRLKGPGRLLVERRRRIWYRIYVLDRLISLQLGRPPAIHEDYCHVPLPSRLGDSDIDWDGDEFPTMFEGPSVGDYHLELISFSKIVSQVLRDLYSPRAGQNLTSDLFNTKELDVKLIQWKQSLPRTLRFDLGHAFDKSFIFKRQRSMLAIKYHHLRALIHRPYLCYPIMRNLDDETEIALSQPNWALVSMYEKVCIAEARETARLLHCISCEKDLVQEFPWWQMISCLICAGSILVVSSIFSQQTGDALDGFDADGISDDAETCLRVFEALSVNSKGARIARDMMEGLKECGLRWRDATMASGPEPPYAALPASHTALATRGHIPSLDGQDASLSYFSFTTPSAWPAEIVDSMAWSVQFFGAVHLGSNAHLRWLVSSLLR